MKTFGRESLLAVACSGVFIASALLGISDRAHATVLVTNDPFTFINLEQPTGQFDERSLGGFEYLISSRATGFRSNDQYLGVGDDLNETNAVVADLGAVGELSATPLDFSIQHNLVGGRNFTFSIDNPSAGGSSVLCWGDNCPIGSTSTPTLNGQAPINTYNGLQLQVRAQEVMDASATISNLSLTGVVIDPGSADLFEGTVTPLTPSTLSVFGDPSGRVGQWLLGDNLDFVLLEWELSGTVTLTRDLAEDDLTMVRLSVDFVNDTRLATIPIPAALPLFVSAIAILAGINRRRAKEKAQYKQAWKAR
ncbi:MAG: hypothetical protein ACR2P1_05585 [Pseudomonadales bacterium]